MNEEHHIEPRWNKRTKENKDDYRTRLTASLNVVRLLLRQRLPFRGHGESDDSSNQGNFLEFLKFLAQHNEDVGKACLGKIPGNLKLISSDIQKDLVSACAKETTKKIIEEIGDSLFSILVDEARDVSTKEQMAIVFRYVDKFGHVIERFMGIIHVKSTTSLSLKNGIDDFFSKHNLSMSSLRGQGYEVHTDLLLCMACLDPSQSFARYDKEKLIHLATFYPKDFIKGELSFLDNQLETYILDVTSDEQFLELKGIGELAQKMVQTRKNDLYQLVYKLITLALILPVATASVERVFSAMNLVKTYLRNRMGDEWMANCLITYAEKEIFNSIDNEAILQRYQKMSTRRKEL